MFAICIEVSHKRGMGHFFRALNLIEFLSEKQESYILFVNSDEKNITLLKDKMINFEIVDLCDFSSNWESQLICKYQIDIWINDRLDTDIRHVEMVKANKVRVVTFDDRGTGAVLSDLNIAAMTFDNVEKLAGNKVLSGVEYLVLNKEIARYRRVRRKCENILVTLGGSDTYGVTIKVINILNKYEKKATVVLGPSFGHWEALRKIINDNFIIKFAVPSLIEEFNNYDIAITGGGITPFEANASGLPCIIIANESHEIEIGKYLESMGASIFAGYYKNINEQLFGNELQVMEMSKKGIDLIKLDSLEKIYREMIIC